MMTDITKYRNVSLRHNTYSKLDRLSKTITPGIQLSISKTIEALVSDRLANPKNKEYNLSLEQETINEFKHIFWSKKGYMAVPTGEQRANGKQIYKYNAISTEIQDIHWQNHFRTATALTPSPIVNSDECCWGSFRY